MVSTVIEMKLDLPDRLISSIYDQKGAATTNVNNVKVGRKFCILTCPIDVPSSIPFPSSNGCNPLKNMQIK